MSLAQHHEKHFKASDTVRDIVIGMSDGLTVPFALAAGISGAVASTHIIVTAGLAEIAAGAIAMGLGGYLAARTDEQHYASERKRELYEIDNLNHVERAETQEILETYGLTKEEAGRIVDSLAADKEHWTDWMMRFELGLEKPDPRRASKSAATIGGSYIIGGFIPLLSYMLVSDVHRALALSIVFTLLALALFGAVKGRLTGIPPFKGAAQTVLVGGLAAAVAFGIARLIGAG